MKVEVPTAPVLYIKDIKVGETFIFENQYNTKHVGIKVSPKEFLLNEWLKNFDFAKYCLYVNLTTGALFPVGSDLIVTPCKMVAKSETSNSK